MKRILLLMMACVFLSTALYAQLPEGFSKQAILRDAENQVVANEVVSLELSILHGSESGTLVYAETHSVESNAYGLITLIIGRGSSVSGSFNEIDWADGPYFLHTEIDPEGSTQYSTDGVTELVAVPYAFFTQTADEYEETDPVFSAWDKSEGITITEDQVTDLKDYITEETQSLADVVALGNSAQDQIKNVSEPTDDLDGTTKAYVDDLVDMLTSRVEDIEDELGVQPPDAPGTVSDIDGNVYNIVTIGDQEWIDRSLMVTKYRNGDPLLSDLDNMQWENTDQGAYGHFSHQHVDDLESDEEVIDAYGLLYNWYATVDARGLCPEGWRVPTDADLTTLVDHMGGSQPPTALYMRSCRQVDSPLGGDCDTEEHPRWRWGPLYGTDNFGFGALPGGQRIADGTYSTYHLFRSYFLWSSTEDPDDPERAWYRSLFYTDGGVGRYSIDKNSGYEVRCMRDVEE